DVVRRSAGRCNATCERNRASYKIKLFCFAEFGLNKVVVDAIAATNNIAPLLEGIPGKAKTRTKVILIAAFVRIAFARNDRMARIRSERIEKWRTILPVIAETRADSQIWLCLPPVFCNIGCL